MYQDSIYQNHIASYYCVYSLSSSSTIELSHRRQSPTTYDILGLKRFSLCTPNKYSSSASDATPYEYDDQLGYASPRPCLA